MCEKRKACDSSGKWYCLGFCLNISAEKWTSILHLSHSRWSFWFVFMSVHADATCHGTTDTKQLSGYLQSQAPEMGSMSIGTKSLLWHSAVNLVLTRRKCTTNCFVQHRHFEASYKEIWDIHSHTMTDPSRANVAETYDSCNPFVCEACFNIVSTFSLPTL